MTSRISQSSPSFLRRIALAALLVVSLALVALYVREGAEGPLHGVQQAVQRVTGTASQTTSGLGGLGSAASGALEEATVSEETLSELRAQNKELRASLAAAEEDRQKARRLEALLGMKQTTGLTGVAAPIVGRSATAWSDTLTIGVGQRDGIATGMAVMSPEGVIGQVTAVSSTSSTVRLLTDPNAGAAVMIQSSRAHGIVRGSFSGLLHLEDIDESQLPSVGDVVVTSGLGGSYVSGLLVGQVVSVNASASNATGTIVVSQNASVDDLEEVFVVTRPQDGPAAETPAS
ncbi:rod shape-determining protein MreC [Eggerthellaceae bacterium zg-997]|nr:rod shape-determining protein MreC [Eggerthellaceae bacterium zg-997]